MGSYDIFLLVIVIGAVGFGAIKGLAWQIAALSAIFVSYIVALNFHELLAGYIETDEPWNRYIAMFALYMGTSLAIWVGFAAVRRGIEKVELKDFDRQAGAVLGAVNGAIVCLLVTLFAVTLPVLGDDQKTAICQSHSGHFIADAIGQIKVGLPEDVNDVVTPYLDPLQERLDEHHDPDDGHSLFPSSHNEDAELTADENRTGPGDLDSDDGATEHTANSLLDDIDSFFENR